MTAVSGLVNGHAQQRLDEPAFIIGADDQTLTWRALARCADRVWRLAGERRLPSRVRIGPIIDDPLAFTAGYLIKRGAEKIFPQEMLRRRLRADLPALGGIR
jgi:hypothetical protein